VPKGQHFKLETQIGHTQEDLVSGRSGGRLDTMVTTSRPMLPSSGRLISVFDQTPIGPQGTPHEFNSESMRREVERECAQIKSFLMEESENVQSNRKSSRKGSAVKSRYSNLRHREEEVITETSQVSDAVQRKSIMP